MSRIRMQQTPAAQIPIPPGGKGTLFLDTDNIFKAKLSDGTILLLSTTDEYIQDVIGALIQDSATIDMTYNDALNVLTLEVNQAAIDHGSVSGLTDDDHLQYVAKDGRAGGQTIAGGTAASEELVITSTQNATKGKIKISVLTVDESTGNVGIGTTAPTERFQVTTGNVNFGILQGEGQTVGNVNSDILTFSIPNGQSAKITCDVVGKSNTNLISAFERSVRLKNIGGVLTIGPIQSDFTSRELAASTNATFVVVGSNIVVRVTGATGVTIDWSVTVRMHRR